VRLCCCSPSKPPLTKPPRRKKAVTLGDAHTDQVNALAFSPNGVYVATGGLDRRVVVWLAERGVAVAKTTVHEVGRGGGGRGGRLDALA
jgi:WD40 repeat protein